MRLDLGVITVVSTGRDRSIEVCVSDSGSASSLMFAVEIVDVYFSKSYCGHTIERRAGEP
jgi:hypothetical protein